MFFVGLVLVFAHKYTQKFKRGQERAEQRVQSEHGFVWGLQTCGS